jgi:hypothetical protein
MGVQMMKTYQYNDIAFDGMNEYNIVQELDEVDILDEHWDHWCERMKKVWPKFRKDEMDFRAKSECIDDFLFLNWAWEKK